LKNFGFKEEIIKKRVDWALNLLDLKQYRKISPFMLSGGERKRVALASVLAWDPEIVVLDEPTIGQDHQQKEKLQQFILQLNSQGKTVIIVTHDIEFVAEIKPRIVLMAHGKIIADGEASKILTNQKFVEDSSLVMPEIAQIISKLDSGFREDIIGIHEAEKAILERIGETK
jgi:energy-coupling factor transport system ATP-binding protein